MPAVELGPIEGVGVLGTGVAFPALKLSNLEVLQRLKDPLFGTRQRPTSDEELRFIAESMETTLGVRERYWSHVPGTPLHAEPEESVVDLAVRAARNALQDAAVDAEALAMVLVATSTPHRMTSTVSAQVATALGASGAAMDTRTGCSGGLFALATGAQLVAGGAGPVLVVGVDAFSRVLPPQSRIAAMSLGDGAAALVLGARKESAIESVYLKTDGSLGQLITTDGALPPTHSEIDRGGYVLSGAPEALTAVVPGKYEEAIGAALKRAKRNASEIEYYAPHQTSRALIGEVCRRTGLAPQRAFIGVERHANIGAAGWMAAMHYALESAELGARVLTASVGGGMSWGAAVLRW
jgi:3-oxoacyl-[acyl-carrier-protein] synthase III